MVINVTSGGDKIVTFADDSTKRCVDKCPYYPRLYGVN